MPETRYIDTYKDGVLISHVPYEVSDAQLQLEALESEINEKHEAILAALKHWELVPAAEKDQILNWLAKFYIVAGSRLNLFVI